VLAIAGCSGATAAGVDAAVIDAFAVDAPMAADAPPADALVAPDAAVADALANDAGPLGPCTDDSREDDDTLAVGLAASALSDLDGTVDVPGLVACPGDDDFLHGYSDCCDDPLGAEIRWNSADGVLELSVLAPDGTAWPVDDVVMDPDRARSVETATAMGHDFVVRVHNPGATPIAYDATVYARVFGP
jgi:hypothetical protein